MSRSLYTVVVPTDSLPVGPGYRHRLFPRSGVPRQLSESQLCLLYTTHLIIQLGMLCTQYMEALQCVVSCPVMDVRHSFEL